MAQPGDRSKTHTIATPDLQLDPDPATASQPTTTDPTQPTRTTTTSPLTMGVISRLPQPLPYAMTKTADILAQPLIEQYFTQSKFYTENLPIIFPVTPTKLDQPGPSGLPSPKTKPSTSNLGKVKKKKPEHLAVKKSFTCPVCHRSFNTSEKLNKHYQSHTGSSPFKCDHCKKTFSSKFKLVRHTLIHSDRKPFSCTACDRTFHRKDHLKNHIKVHSPSKKTYTCENTECKKQYTSLLSYRKHLAVHAAEEGNLTCQICSQSFQNKEEILYHLKIHAGSRTVKNPSEKKYTCDYCERRFFTKKDVRRHLVVHTGMRDFLCQFCPQRFGRKDHLVRHIKKSHNKKFIEEASTIVKPEVKTEIVEAMEATMPFQEDIDFSLENVKTIFEESSLAPLAEEELLLKEGELKELGSEVLKEIEEKPSTSRFEKKHKRIVQTESQQTRVLDEMISLVDPRASTGGSSEFEEVQPQLVDERVSLSDPRVTTSKSRRFEEVQPPLLDATLSLGDSSVRSSEFEGIETERIMLSNSPIEPSGFQESSRDDSQRILDESMVLNDPEMLRLLQPTEERNLPLPGFRQTFQPPPPPKS